MWFITMGLSGLAFALVRGVQAIFILRSAGADNPVFVLFPEEIAFALWGFAAYVLGIAILHSGLYLGRMLRLARTTTAAAAAVSILVGVVPLYGWAWLAFALSAITAILAVVSSLLMALTITEKR
jgi:hypothetical protein